MADNETRTITIPATEPENQIEASYTDPKSGAVYVHKDLTQVIAPWDVESHVPPVSATELFGDVASWAAYVKRYGPTGTTIVTWSEKALTATLDYHTRTQPGRAQWKARHEFKSTLEWRAWTEVLGGGGGVSQQLAVEKLEERLGDITAPPAADVLNILRSLRGNVKANAETTLRPDGTTSVSFSQDNTARGAGGVELPAALTIQIPVLKGLPALYKINVRLRVTVTNDAKLALRFSPQNVDKIWEEVVSEQVAAAEEALGADYKLLRAA